MNLKESSKLVGKFLDRFVWIVGMTTIMRYSQERWPTATTLALWLLGGVIMIWFLWHCFVVPFLAGLKGETK